jgi:hypothetical protein
VRGACPGFSTDCKQGRLLDAVGKNIRGPFPLMIFEGELRTGQISVVLRPFSADNQVMSTETITTEVTKQQFDELIAKLMRCEPRVSEEIRKSRERMDFLREETRKRVGTVEVAVDFIRELRDR